MGKNKGYIEHKKGINFERMQVEIVESKYINERSNPDAGEMGSYNTRTVRELWEDPHWLEQLDRLD